LQIVWQNVVDILIGINIHFQYDWWDFTDQSSHSGVSMKVVSIILFLSLLFIASHAQQQCFVEVNVTFTGVCALTTSGGNNSRWFSNATVPIVKAVDQFGILGFLRGLNNSQLIPGDPCRITYFNYICSSLGSCHNGHVVKPCYSTCVDYKYQCSFTREYKNVTAECDTLSGVGLPFAAANETNCERIWYASGYSLDMSLLVLLIASILFI
jgi:hypothetical protein